MKALVGTSIENPATSGILSVVGGSIVTLLKHHIKEMNKKKKESINFQADIVASGLRVPIKKISKGENPYIFNYSLFKELDEFNSPGKLGGLWFIYSSPGSGKSTHIREYIDHVVSRNGHATVLSGISSIEKLRHELSIPVDGQLSAFIPKDTLIAIDQLESCQIGVDTDNFFVSLATESRNDGVFRVVVCVSEPEKADRWLRLNGREKIKDLCSPNVLRWKDFEVDTFIAKRFCRLSSEEKKVLRELALRAGLPGFLVDVADSYGVDRLDIQDSNVMMKLNKSADAYSDMWINFDKVDDL